MNELELGALLQGGKYRIEKTLGQGGFGITYLAEQTNLGRKVCIKEFFMKEYGERTTAPKEDSQETVLTDGASSPKQGPKDNDCNKQIYFRHFFAKLFRHFSHCFCDSSVLVYT